MYAGPPWTLLTSARFERPWFGRCWRHKANSVPFTAPQRGALVCCLVTRILAIPRSNEGLAGHVVKQRNKLRSEVSNILGTAGRPLQEQNEEKHKYDGFSADLCCPLWIAWLDEAVVSQWARPGNTTLSGRRGLVCALGGRRYSNWYLGSCGAEISPQPWRGNISLGRTGAGRRI